MDRPDLLLAALAPADRQPHTPVQLQKLLFLIDREIPELVGGPHFDFRPYHYGPFDTAVYQELDALATAGLVDTQGHGSWRTYSLTPIGQAKGERIIGELDPKAKNFIQRASEFVRSLSFAALVAAVYKAYPEMRVNSVFQS